MFSLILSFLLLASCALPAFAAECYRLSDFVGLLDADEEEELLERLDEVSEEWECDVVAAIVESLQGEDVSDYAGEFFEQNNYGYGDGEDGILFLISIEERDWIISLFGFDRSEITDSDFDRMADEVLPYLRDDDYTGAIEVYADCCDDLLSSARTMSDNGYFNNKDPFEAFKAAGISVLAGFGIALIVVLIMKARLKSVRFQSAAAEYVRPGSMNLTFSRDIYLYRTVTRKEIPNNTSGSGGRSYSGQRSRSGKF